MAGYVFYSNPQPLSIRKEAKSPHGSSQSGNRFVSQNQIRRVFIRIDREDEERQRLRDSYCEGMVNGDVSKVKEMDFI